MNRSLGVEGRRPSGTLQHAPPSFHFVVNLLKLVQADTNLALDFSLAFEIREFQLGDELIKGNIAPAGYYVQNEHEVCGIYLICQGRVRLLGFDANQQREVSTLVLETGEIFGAENLFCTEPVVTRAIAASAGMVAWIGIANLEPWLEQLPNLQDYLRQQAIERQCLIFFKTSTELRSLPSHQLRQLLPYLVETRIKTGELLVQATPPGTGRFWLCSGQIQSQLGKSQPPSVGQSWGDPDLTLADWIAQTDLVVYQLPREHWEAAQVIAPVLAASSKEPTGLVKAKASGNGHVRPASRVALSQSRADPHTDNHRLQTQSEPHNNTRQAES